MSKLDKLKEVTAQKKTLSEQQRQLRDDLNSTLDDRKNARKVQARARKNVRENKAEIRSVTAKIYDHFSIGDPEAISDLADEIMEIACELSGNIRIFSEAAEVLEDL
jgi:hypothetical protein